MILYRLQFFFLILVCYTTAHTQTFEGIVRYEIIYDYADSVKQQKGLEQRALAASAETQKSTDLLKEQLKFYKYSNTRVELKEKRHLDSLLHMTKSGGSTEPNNFVMMIKTGAVLTRMEGGSPVHRKELLYPKNEVRGAFVLRNNRNYLYYPSVTPATQPLVIKKQEIIHILGFPCTRYEVEVNHKNGYPSRQVIWATKAIPDLDKKVFLKIGLGLNQHNMSFKAIDGIPLRIQSFFPGAVVTMEAVEVKVERLRDDDFIIPENFFRIPDQK